MKPHHIIGGIVGLIVLAVWAVIHMTVSFIFTGRCWNDDLEINKALALAIGWPRLICTGGLVLVSCAANWRVFDYADWNVIGPIAAKYNKFSYAHRGKDGLLDGKWVVWPNTLEATPQRAIAMSVISAMKETP